MPRGRLQLHHVCDSDSAEDARYPCDVRLLTRKKRLQRKPAAASRALVVESRNHERIVDAIVRPAAQREVIAVVDREPGGEILCRRRHGAGGDPEAAKTFVEYA